MFRQRQGVFWTPKKVSTPAPARGKNPNIWHELTWSKFKRVAGVGVNLNIMTDSSQILNNKYQLRTKFSWCRKKISSKSAVYEDRDQVTDSHLLDVRRLIAIGVIAGSVIGRSIRGPDESIRMIHFQNIPGYQCYRRTHWFARHPTEPGL